MRATGAGVVMVSVSVLVGCISRPDPAAIFGGSAGRWIDLTHTLSSQAIFWPTAEPFRLERVTYGMTHGGYFYAANNFCSAEHGGTHLDAPIHFAEGKQTADQIPIDHLIGPAVVVDVTDHASPDYLVRVSDLQSWEAAFGPIPDGAIILVRTGWGRRWTNREEYLGTALTGPEAVPQLHFPGIDPEAARWLVDNRNIDAVGIDTPSIDYGQSSTFETHQILYAANIPGFENVANLDQLPEAGSFVVALPAKIGEGSGGPLRIVAFVSN